MKITINSIRPLFYAALLSILFLSSCSKDYLSDTSSNAGMDISFTATLATTATVEAQTKATTSSLTYTGDITVIAPGYANKDASLQKAIYTAKEGSLTLKAENNAIKQTAKEMQFAAWTTSGVAPATNAVDFSTPTDLENLIGAQLSATSIDATAPVALPFKHLVSKLALTVMTENIEKPGNKTECKVYSILFPAIKKIGLFTTSLEKGAEVINGNSGDALSVSCTAASTTPLPIYLPSFGNFAENGTFILTVEGTEYIGTLNDLKNAGTTTSITELKAGENINLTVLIKQDNTVQFMAATIAPWNESGEKELNNRPCPGIWSGEDLIAFAKAYNTVNTDASRATELAKYTDESNTTRLYTDITVGAGFTPIGTSEQPFTGTFDGNGYTISNLKIEVATADNQGLFGTIKEKTTLKDIRLQNCIINGHNNVGLLVGKAINNTGAAGTTDITLIDNCRIIGGIATGHDNIGGLVGNAAAATVQISNASVQVGSVSGTTNIGGIAGSCAGSIRNSYALLSVGMSGQNVGGLVGNFTSISPATLSNCYASPKFINGTNNDTHGTLLGTAPKANNNISFLYWDLLSLDTDKCPAVIVGVDASKYSSPFNIITGKLVNQANKLDTGEYLFDKLNEKAQSTDKGWAIVGASRLPILKP
ncbi:MAG: fimbrillin family protein [Bacteroidaceae bacterium]